MATLCYVEQVHIAWTQIQMPIQTQIAKHYCTHLWDRHPYLDWDPSSYLAM